MENTDNQLVNRQLEVVRKNLVTVFRFTVKALIDKACFSSVDDGCEEFINFSAAMEQVLHHRLRPSKVWYLGDNKNHFWYYIKAACHRHDLRSCINNIDNIENIKTSIGKGRAFLRCALMEKRLAEYLGEALKQTNVTRRFYQEGAIMLGEEASELCGVLVGLNSIDFGFCLKGENYDSVPGPLAVSYSQFMKFKQSPESLHSDMEEMRELSCGSSLASEDGQEAHDGTADTWQERYNLLHKRYMRVLEQKSFLEELTAAQEKSLQMASATHEEQRHIQQETERQHRQYEAVILELQAQVARMKAVNESLQRQLALARQARSPITEMAFRGESQVEASRFAAAMAYRDDSEQANLKTSDNRDAANRPIDTRSLTSAISELSAEVVSQTERGLHKPEDSQSMVPLTGSLSDLQGTGQDISSITSIPAETASSGPEIKIGMENLSGKSADDGDRNETLGSRATLQQTVPEGAKRETVGDRDELQQTVSSSSGEGKKSDTVGSSERCEGDKCDPAGSHRGSIQSTDSKSGTQSQVSDSRTSAEVNGNSLSLEKTHHTATTDLDSSCSQLDSTQSQLDSTQSQAGSEVRDDKEDTSERLEEGGEEGEDTEGEEDRKGREMASVWHDGLQESIVILRGPSSHYSQDESLEIDTEDFTHETPSEMRDLTEDFTQETPSEMRDLADYSEMTEDPQTSNKDDIPSSEEDASEWASEAQQAEEKGKDTSKDTSGTQQTEGKAKETVVDPPEEKAKETVGGSAGMTRRSDKMHEKSKVEVAELKDAEGKQEGGAQSIKKEESLKQEEVTQENVSEVGGAKSDYAQSLQPTVSLLSPKGDSNDMVGSSDAQQQFVSPPSSEGEKNDIIGSDRDDRNDAASGSDRDGSDIEILQEPAHDKNSSASGSEKGDGSEPEILTQADAKSSTNSSDKEGSEPEILTREKVGDQDDIVGGREEGSETVGDREGTVGDREGTETTDGGDGPEAAAISGQTEDADPKSSTQKSSEEAENVKDSSANQNLPKQEQEQGTAEGNGSGSDSSGSDIAKETWDMLSDANHDSS